MTLLPCPGRASADPGPYHPRQEIPPVNLDGRPYLKDDGGELSLHFDFATIQSTMRRSDPHGLHVDYTRVMMGFLLLAPEPRTIAMIGLGGGSLAKYCHQRLPGADFTAIEISPEVIALRNEFHVPPDNERFRIVRGDGAAWVREQANPVDVLLVDGFDLTGQPQALCSAAFYADCRRALSPRGVLAVNLWAEDEFLSIYVSRLRDAFAGQVFLVDTDDAGNKVAFAYAGADFPPSARILERRAAALAEEHPLGLTMTARKMARKLESRARKMIP